jgi:hypothetical protein
LKPVVRTIQKGVTLSLSRSRIELAVPLASDPLAWDEFVEQHPEGRFSQLWGFQQVLERTYGYRIVYRKILLDGELAGIFPSVAVGRRKLISQPFQEYGGPLTRALSLEQNADLAEALFRLGEQQGCSSLEIRGGIGCEPLAESQYCKRHHLYRYAVLPLREKELLWKKSLVQEARKAVKRGQNAGLQVEILRGETAIAAPFYHMYLVSMKRLGVPPHPEHFFTNLVAGLGQRVVSAIVTHEGRRVAYLLGLITGKRIQVYITASDPDAWAMRPNDLAHWELMNWAFRSGITSFDFGSARYAGQIHFKQKWGVTFYDYSYYLVGPANSDATSRVESVSSSSKLMTATANIWRRVMPLRLSSVLGPPIRKYLTK